MGPRLTLLSGPLDTNCATASEAYVAQCLSSSTHVLGVARGYQRGDR